MFKLIFQYWNEFGEGYYEESVWGETKSEVKSKALEISRRRGDGTYFIVALYDYRAENSKIVCNQVAV